MKCVDCNRPISKPGTHRRDICQRCWDLRKLTIGMVKSGAITVSDFREIQVAMGNGCGQKAMLQATNHDLYEI